MLNKLFDRNQGNQISKVLSSGLISRKSGSVMFRSIWDTTNTSNAEASNSDQISLPLISTGTYDFYIQWGDGNTNHITSYNQAEVTHTYDSEGIYTLKIVGTLIGFAVVDGGDSDKLLEILRRGSAVLGASSDTYSFTTE